MTTEATVECHGIPLYIKKLISKLSYSDKTHLTTLSKNLKTISFSYYLATQGPEYRAKWIPCANHPELLVANFYNHNDSCREEIRILLSE